MTENNARNQAPRAATQAVAGGRRRIRYRDNRARLCRVARHARQLTGNRGQFRSRGRERHPGGQLTNHEDEWRRPIGQHAFLAVQFVERHQRNPHLGRFAKRHAAKGLWRHADDRGDMVVHLDGAPDHAGVAGEALAPEPFADDGDETGCVQLTIAVRERPALHRMNSERLEIVRGHGGTLDGVTAVGRREHEPGELLRQQALEGAAGRPHIEVVRIAAGGMLFSIDHPSERDQMIRADARRRLRQDAVHHREDRHVAADDERDQENGGQAQCRRPPQNPGTNLDVGDQLLQRDPRPDGSGRLLRECPIPELEQRASTGFARRLAPLETIASRHREVRRNLLINLVVSPAVEPNAPCHGYPSCSPVRINACIAATS